MLQTPGPCFSFHADGAKADSSRHARSRACELDVCLNSFPVHLLNPGFGDVCEKLHHGQQAEIKALCQAPPCFTMANSAAKPDRQRSPSF